MPDQRIPTLLFIDCEPDLRLSSPEEPSPWLGLEQMIKRVDALRDGLALATGTDAYLSWGLRMDPQITTLYGSPSFAMDRYGAFFSAVARGGDAIGLHTHAWRWNEDDRTWIADHGDEDWVQLCLETSYDAYRDAFGETAMFHSVGSNFMSNAVMNAVRRQGSRYDFTLAPGEPRVRPGRKMGAMFTGTIPDYGRIPRVPYRPRADDYQVPLRDGTGDGEFVAVPLSSGVFVPRDAPGQQSARSRDLRRLAPAVRTRTRSGLGNVLGAMTGRRRRPYGLLAMWRDWRSPTDFWDAAFATVDELESPYLAFVIRSDTPVDDDLCERFDAIIGHLGSDPRAERLAFTTPDAAFGHRLGAPHTTSS